MSLQFGKELSSIPVRVVPIPKGELRVINIDPHNKKEKGLVPVPTPRGEIIWVHLDIIESQQWTTITHRKSKGMTKASSSNVMGISTTKTEKDVASLTSLWEEESSWLLRQVLFLRQRPNPTSSSWNSMSSRWQALPRQWKRQLSRPQAARGQTEGASLCESPSKRLFGFIYCIFVITLLHPFCNKSCNYTVLIPNLCRIWWEKINYK